MVFGEIQISDFDNRLLWEAFGLLWKLETDVHIFFRCIVRRFIWEECSSSRALSFPSWFSHLQRRAFKQITYILHRRRNRSTGSRTFLWKKYFVVFCSWFSHLQRRAFKQITYILHRRRNRSTGSRTFLWKKYFVVLWAVANCKSNRSFKPLFKWNWWRNCCTWCQEIFKQWPFKYCIV